MKLFTISSLVLLFIGSQLYGSETKATPYADAQKPRHGNIALTGDEAKALKGRRPAMSSSVANTKEELKMAEQGKADTYFAKDLESFKDDVESEDENFIVKCCGYGFRYYLEDDHDDHLLYLLELIHDHAKELYRLKATPNYDKIVLSWNCYLDAYANNEEMYNAMSQNLQEGLKRLLDILKSLQPVVTKKHMLELAAGLSATAESSSSSSSTTVPGPLPTSIAIEATTISDDVTLNLSPSQ